jgi:hypothetical protein
MRPAARNPPETGYLKNQRKEQKVDTKIRIVNDDISQRETPVVDDGGIVTQIVGALVMLMLVATAAYFVFWSLP